MAKRIGKYTLEMENPPGVVGNAAVVGKKEGEGPLGPDFDYIYEDTTLGQASWEKAESELQKDAVSRALTKAKVSPEAVSFIFAGDLLNQCIGSTYGLRAFNIPFVGLFGACSTMALSLAAASVFMDSGAAELTVAVTSSHFCSAERQFRFPLEYGGQRPPTAQWTVTGAGAAVLGQYGSPRIGHVTMGRIADLGVKDQNNMGAAMAPAAAETIKDFLSDTCTKPEDYDLIATGDLGRVGSTLLYELLEKEQIDIKSRHIDCGSMIYNPSQEDVYAGGSGCGCSASVLCSRILNRMRSGEYKSILFIATGALMSPTSVQQGESIPGVAHLIHFIG